MAPLLTKPYALNAGEGQNLGSHTAPLFLEASSEQTAGAFDLFAASRLPGYAASLFGAIVTYGFRWYLGHRYLASSALKPRSESEHKP